MNRIRLTLSALVVLSALAGTAPEAAAYQYSWDCRGPVVWDSTNVTFEPSLISFPNGSAWQGSIDAMRVHWNTNSPGARYRIQHTWSPNANWALNDGRNSIVIAAPADWIWGNALAVAIKRRSNCNWWPFARAELREADIAFNPAPVTPFGFPTVWEHAANPVPPHPQGPYNAILVGIHEHGHAFGLDHEDDIMATLNAFYPNSGVIGNDNDPHPHADDTLANRAGYGTATTSRDLAASAFRRAGVGTSEVIPPPAATDRNARVNFQFTVENRGTTNESSVPVRFYLSADRNLTTGDTFLGSTALSLNAGTSSTLTASVIVPATAPTGNQFLGWVIDPFNAVAEADEGNNGVGLTATVNIRTNRAPTACFTASPNNAPAPAFVTFNASCSSDLDGNPLTYTWNFGDGSTGSGVSPGHFYSAGGFYSVTLTVRDSTGATATATDFIQLFCQGPGGQGEFCLE